jgi:hypothetical protein
VVFCSIFCCILLFSIFCCLQCIPDNCKKMRFGHTNILPIISAKFVPQVHATTTDHTSCCVQPVTQEGAMSYDIASPIFTLAFWRFWNASPIANSWIYHKLSQWSYGFFSIVFPVTTWIIGVVP